VPEVVFLDTNVLLNLLDVPRRNDRRAEADQRFRRLAKEGTLMIVPIVAVIEAGNEIAQISGAARRAHGDRLVTWLRHGLGETAPFTTSGAIWDAAFLRDLVDGRAGCRSLLVELCTADVGAGDAAVLHELQRYRERVDLPSATPLRLWRLASPRPRWSSPAGWARPRPPSRWSVSPPSLPRACWPKAWAARRAGRARHSRPAGLRAAFGRGLVGAPPQPPPYGGPRDRGGAMIARYTREAMGRVWSEAHKYELWCRVEVLALEAHALAGRVPAEVVEPVRAAPPPTAERVDEIEQTTQHDVIAFLSAWADNTTPREAAAYVHFGMTSSDLLDTALALQLIEATDLLLAGADSLVAALRDLGLEHRDTVRVGRTHGIHAEPDVFGHRVADLAFGLARCRDRLRAARAGVAVAKISGAVGSYSNIDPGVERHVAAALGLTPAPVATQVVLRDGIAHWVAVLAEVATVCEAVALEIRHGQRTEVRELAEPFGKQQKGSSAMPHKKNPIASERIAGLARIVRAQVVPVLEGIPLWHERDISHSSTERVALPDAAITTDYLLALTERLIRGLVVDKARMRANLDSSGGLAFSSAVLLELVELGLSREDAYAVTQRAAMRTWDTGTAFRTTLGEELGAAGLSVDDERLGEAFRPERYVERLGPVFDRLAALA